MAYSNAILVGTALQNSATAYEKTRNSYRGRATNRNTNEKQEAPGRLVSPTSNGDSGVEGSDYQRRTRESAYWDTRIGPFLLRSLPYETSFIIFYARWEIHMTYTSRLHHVSRLCNY